VDRAPAADKGLQEPPTTLPALLRTMVGAERDHIPWMPLKKANANPNRSRKIPQQR